jgi:hypothetical protein
VERPEAGQVNVSWSMDFVCDSLFNGRRFRVLTIVYNYSRECLALEVGQNLSGGDVVAVMDRLAAARGAPERIWCDNVLTAESSHREKKSPVEPITVGRSILSRLLSAVVFHSCPIPV